MFIVKDCTRNPPYTMVSNDAKNVRDIVIGITGDEMIGDHVLLHLRHILHAERDENGNLLREMQKVIDPAERLSDTSKAMTDIMDKLIASRGKRSEIPGIVEDNIDCNEGLNKHFGGCEE